MKDTDRSRRLKFVRPAIVLSGAIVLYALAGFLMVPWIAKGRLVDKSRN